MEKTLREPIRKADAASWLMAALGVMWLAVFPLWQGGSYSDITRSKWIGMLAMTGLTVIGCIGAVVLRLVRGEKLRFSWVQAAALGYFGLVALSAVFGAWADHSTGEYPTVLLGAHRYEGLVTQLCYGAIFLGMSMIRGPLTPVMHLASVTVLLYGVMVALQYAGVNVLGLFPAGTSVLTNYEFQGTIGNIDVVTGYLSITMAAALGGFVCVKPNGLWLTAGLVGALLLLMMEVQCGIIMLGALLLLLALAALRWPRSRWRVCAVLAGTLTMVSLRLLIGLPWLDGTADVCLRFAWWRLLPLAGGVLLAGLGFFLWRRPGKGLPWLMIAILAAMLVLIVLAAVYWMPLPEGNGLWEMQELLHGRPEDSYGSERIGIWRLTLELCRDDLLWGLGPDTFLHAMDHHLWRTGQSLVQRFDNPHNLLLGVLANSGLPALGMYLLLCGGPVVWAACRMEKNPELIPLMLAVICYFVQGMFTFSICLVTPIFWAVLGMLTAELKERNEE